MVNSKTLWLAAAGLLFSLGAHAQAGIDDVWAPVKVAVAPGDAYIGLSYLGNGELRYYNYGEQSDYPKNYRGNPENGSFYLESKDYGLTWKQVRYSRDIPQADMRSPLSGEYVRLVNGGNATYCIRTDGGIDGGRTVRKISGIASIMLKPPVFIRGGRRIVVAAHGGVSPKGCYTYVSDDDGLTWTRSNTVTSPDHVKGGFHEGTRWNHGAVEPTVVELRDGRLWMIMRTAQDFHYEAFSEDGGLTWGESRPSVFWGTITMPTIGRLSDGRLLMLWCNTTPLPELKTADGVWDDVFTNRDVCHAAVSDDDGKTWHGCRELMMNPYRNDADFGSANNGVDLSVHQAQFVEVAPGKICAALGQNSKIRSVVLFDVGWLLEKERVSDLSAGLDDWSVFNYRKGIVGHCSYNRVEGLKTVDGMLHVVYEKDDSLVSDVRGGVWNFPASKKGSVCLDICMPADDDGISLLLNDHWMNPCDTVARHYSMAAVELSRKSLKIRDDSIHSVSLTWDDCSSGKGRVTVHVDGKKRSVIPICKTTPLGISYIHLQADRPSAGVYVKSVKAVCSSF